MNFQPLSEAARVCNYPRRTRPTPPHKTHKIEWRTWLAIVAVHAAWLTVLNSYATAGAVLAVPLILLLTWHSSICHEILHGHPTRIVWLNDLLAQLPLSLFVPYFKYKESHLRHHRNADITVPMRDPESFFVAEQNWRTKNPAARALARAQMTVAGRLLFGPGIAFGKLLRQLGASIAARRWQHLALYTVHFALATVIILLAHFYFALPAWQYLIIAYLSQSLLLLRAFYEHRPHPTPACRTVIMQSCAPLRWLYLNNNYHAVHHAHPKMPWYELPDEYRRNQAQYLKDNGNFYFRGYRDWLIYLFKPVAEPVHPSGDS